MIHCVKVDSWREAKRDTGRLSADPKDHSSVQTEETLEEPQAISRGKQRKNEHVMPRAC